MEHPYRFTENESIIIDTRISALETQVKSVTTWRRLAIAFAVLAVATCSYAFYAGGHANAEQPCRDEVLVVSEGLWSHSAVATCSHSKHRSEVSQTTTGVNNNNHETSVHCVCR